MTTAPENYVLVGGPFTPAKFAGVRVGAMEVHDLLGICQLSPPPNTMSVDGVIKPDTTDADVLGVRAYLDSPWGQVRLFETGNLTLGDFG